MIIQRHQKVAFFCSARACGKILEAVHALPEKLIPLEPTIIAGFHTPIEKIFFEKLCSTHIKMQWVRAFKSKTAQQIPPFAHTAFERKQLVISSSPKCVVSRATEESCEERNNYVCRLVHAILIGYTPKDSHTYQLIRHWLPRKPIMALDFPENQHLFELGVQPLQRQPQLEIEVNTAFQLESLSLADFQRRKKSR